jgi:hypothetical protein
MFVDVFDVVHGRGRVIFRVRIQAQGWGGRVVILTKNATFYQACQLALGAGTAA